jgi:integrase
MALRLKTQRDGKTLRPYWYGAYVEDGKQKVVTLSVKWTGTPPASGRVGDAGDEVFERSREKAAAALSDFVNESKRKGRADTLTERLIESKTGATLQYVRIDELPERWRGLGRDAAPTERYLNACDAHFRRFIDFMAKRNPAAVHLYQVTKEDAGAFKTACAAALAPATAKYNVRLISKACAYFLPVGMDNPFTAFTGKRTNGDSGVVHRRPFTVEQLQRLLEVARDDDFMCPLVVTAAMTGMRRGDVCNLKWSAVDMPGGMLDVKTGKTEATVSIPIWQPLRAILEERGGKGKGYVFPEAAEMHRDNPNGLTYRMKTLLARAFSDVEGAAALSDLVPVADVIDEGIEAIRANMTDPARQSRMIDTLRRYADGQGIRQIEKETGAARSTISADIHAVEGWTGKRFMRGGFKTPDMKAAAARLTRVERDKGERAASVWDWHALRTTWVTLALASGVPETTVRIVTGHATCELVLKHYFKPNKDQLRAALANALPDVLTGERSKRLTAGDELAELVGKVQDGSATDKHKKRLRLLAAKV